MAAKNTLEEAMGVRKTRAAHILIEFDRTAIVSEVAVKLRAALSDTTKVAALENRATVQVKNIDPLTSKEKLVEDIKRQWSIGEGESVDVREEGTVGHSGGCGGSSGQ